MKLSDTLTIDSVEYASQGNAILGMKGSGKSYTATYIAERLMDEGIPFIAFDPIGIWHHLKVGKDGPGYPVVVAGGEHGDLPLTPEGAPDIVRAAMKANVSLVLDLYSMDLSKKDWRHIVEKCIRLLLYENKPCGLRHIFIEEAPEFVPQRVQPEYGGVYAEIEKLARMGGNASLGYTLIGQRPEEINKSVLELCDCLLLHRQKGRHSLTALEKWLNVADATDVKAVINSLPSLPSGDCWVWSGGSHDPERVHILPKKTVHPDRKDPLKSIAGVTSDVSSFITAMNEWLRYLDTQRDRLPEKAAKSSLPRAIDQADLTAKISELTEAIKQRDELIRVLQGESAKYMMLFDRMREMLKEEGIESLVGREKVNEAKGTNIPIRSERGEIRPAPRKKAIVIGQPKENGTIGTSGTVGKCAKDIIAFLAQYERGFSKAQIGISIGYSPTSGHFSNALGELTKRYLIIRGKKISANREKIDEIKSLIGPIKKKKYNISTFREQLGKCEREIYDVLIKHPLTNFDKERLAELTQSNYSGGSGHFGNALGTLIKLDLIKRDSGLIFLNPDLAKML